MASTDSMEARPWGYYHLLYTDENTKVKRIVVYPGQKLSYQSHDKRSEDWTIVEGSGIVVFNDVEYRVNRGHHFSIPRQHKHRVINDGNENLVFIEVQTGEYFGEDDITRYKDEYGRAL